MTARTEAWASGVHFYVGRSMSEYLMHAALAVIQSMPTDLRSSCTKLAI